MRRFVGLAALFFAAAVSPAFCGLKLPHVTHGSVDLRPQGFTDYYGMAFWQNHVYVTGWYDEYGSQANVWAVNVANPDSLAYVNKAGWGGQKTWKAEAYDNKLYVAAWGTGLHVFDISAGAIALYPYGIWDPSSGFFWDVGYNNGRAYMLQYGDSGGPYVSVVDTSVIGQYPTQISQFSTTDSLCFGVSVRGSYLYTVENYFSATPDGFRSSLNVYNVSDETNPTFVKTIADRHEMADMVRRGNYLYITTRSWGYSNYNGNIMPGVAEPPWTLVEGSESYSSLASGIMRINDNSTAAGSSVKWRRTLPTATSPANGTTTVIRARCLAAGGDTSGIVNLQIEDGSRRERFQILTDRIVALDSGQTLMMNCAAWHTYRVTTSNTTFNLYVDEYYVPVMTGTLTAATSNKRLTFGGGADAATQDIYIDYLEYNPREDCWPMPSGIPIHGGLEVYDLSDPTNPTKVGEYRGLGGSADLCLLGNGAFTPAGNGGILTVDISNPAAPAGVSQYGLPGYEGAMAGNGRYLYVASQSCVYAVEVLTADPDSAGPSIWTDCSLGEASWDTEYFGDALPSVSSPSWPLTPGDSESMASVSSGALRVNDNSTSSKLQWVRYWDATNTRGGTVLVRARCASYSLNGSPISDLSNISVEDGKYREDFAVLSDRIRAKNAGLEYFLDGTQWHTYRIWTKGSQFRVYVDELPTPAMTGSLSTTTGNARVWFGSSSTTCTQDIYFDNLQCDSESAYAVPAHTTDLTPDIGVRVSDWVEQDSISGLDPASARVQWPTDGGVVWSSPQAITCSSSSGDVCGNLQANAIPFNQYSDTLNKVRFSTQDTLGNTGYSPIYNVRILSANPPGPVTGFAATAGDMLVNLSWTNPTSAQFAGTMVRCETTGYPSSTTDGSLLLNRVGSPGGVENYAHTPPDNGVTYYYRAFAYDKTLSYSTGVNSSATPTDTGPPSPVTNLVAVGADQQVSISWTNPGSADFSGTMIRFSTTGYPTGPTDGTLLVSKAGAPGSTDGHTHTGLTNGVIYYYSAFAYDSVPNYSTKADASGIPSPGMCWTEQFAYPDGPLGGIGGWTGGCSAIEVINQTVKITGGTGTCDVIRPITCSGSGGVIWVRIQVKSGGASPTGTLMWDFWIDDAMGNNLARWYGKSDTARPRIGGTAVVLPTVNLTGNWDTLDVKIDTNSNLSEFFFNGSSLGTLSHTSTGAGDSVGQVKIGRVDNSAGAGYVIYMDNISMGADLTPPAPVTNFRAVGSAGQVALSWTNPTSDFVGTRIVCNTIGYPTGPTDGAVVYSGVGTGTTHSSLENGVRYYYSAYAFDVTPNYSTGANATARPAAEATILEAKGLDDNRLRTLKGNIVSATGSGYFYLQDPLELQGIKVLSSTTVAEGQKVDVVGITGGRDSERLIDCTNDAVSLIDAGPFALSICGMSLSSVGGGLLNEFSPGIVGGVGANNLGLLVRVWGKVTQHGYDYFYISDGGSGLKILADPTDYPDNCYVVVTGAVSTFDNGGLRPCIVPQLNGIQKMLP